MSKNISIQEGGAGRQFTAEKLKTALVGGGSCLWVPEDGVRLGTKVITANGAYTAAEDGFYGFQKVTVRVPGGSGGNGPGGSGDPVPGREGSSVVGTDSDGDEALVSIDTGGRIVQKKVPSSIEIDTPPDRLEYQSGDALDFSGLVVKAMLKSGDPFTDERYPVGIIPRSELDLPVAVADITQAQQVIYTDGMGIVAQPCNFDIPARFFNNDPFMCSMPTGTIVVDGITYPMFYAVPGTVAREGFATRYNGKLYIMTLTGSSPHAFGYVKDGVYKSHGYSSGLIRGTFGDVTFGTGCGDFVSAVSEVDPWYKVFENRTLVSGGQTIPVKWTSPYDGRLLETHFNIMVTSPATYGGDA